MRERLSRMGRAFLRINESHARRPGVRGFHQSMPVSPQLTCLVATIAGRPVTGTRRSVKSEKKSENCAEDGGMTQSKVADVESEGVVESTDGAG